MNEEEKAEEMTSALRSVVGKWLAIAFSIFVIILVGTEV